MQNINLTIYLKKNSEKIENIKSQFYKMLKKFK